MTVTQRIWTQKDKQLKQITLNKKERKKDFRFVSVDAKWNKAEAIKSNVKMIDGILITLHFVLVSFVRKNTKNIKQWMPEVLKQLNDHF